MRRAAGVALVAALALAACGGDDSTGSDGITISDAWARSTPAGATVGAVYVTVRASTDDALVGAAVAPAIAASAEVHATNMDDGMASMAPVASLPVGPDDDLALDPLGDHVMLVGLAAPLTDGEQFDLTLRFRSAGDQVVSVEVRDDAP